MCSILFEVIAKNNLKVRTTKAYWHKIITFKHPSMVGRQDEVQETLKSPLAIRVSKKDPNVLLYYRKIDVYYVCVVVKRLNGEGFIITAYKTENIKEGEQIWPK